MLVHEALDARARSTPDAPAFSVLEVGRLTFGEWAERARSVAAGLVACGLEPGQRVAGVFADSDWIDFAVWFFGVLGAGGVAVAVRPPAPGQALTSLLGPIDVAGVVAEGVTGLPPS